jgi:tetratricopeptide (TPR) repeat protein
MVMLPSGMIDFRKNLSENTPFVPLKKTKEDYFYDGLEYLDEEDMLHALASFKKAMEMDDEYIDAYNGIGNLNMLLEDYKKSKEYYQKAYILTKQHFKGIWPTELEWSILENRQYLRAICGFAICYWKENNIQEAERLFSLLLKLNKSDNQGVRFIVAAILEKITFEQYDKMQSKATENGDYDKIDELFERQNEVHHFWSNPHE